MMVNEQLGRGLPWICAAESTANSDLSHGEVIFRTSKMCFSRPCTISCFALCGSVGLFGVFSPQHFVLLSFLESCFMSRIYFPFDILNS